MGRRTVSLGRGERNIRWIEQYCFVPEGKDVGKPMRLRPWQRDIINGIYDTPTRRAIVSFGRKNGKTSLSAMLLLLHLCGPEAQPNSQLFSAARSREQAGVAFQLAAKMIRMHADLSRFVAIRETAKQIACQELGTLYRALSAEAATAYGLSPILCIHDELGQVRGPRDELFEALETASAAHEHPLSIIISTQAPTDSDLLSILIDDAAKRQDGRTKLFLFTATDDLDPFSDAALRASNPAMGDFQSATELQAMADDAKRMPSRESEFRNLILNQRVEAVAPFITKTVWDQNNGDVIASFDDQPVYAGLDLSETNDLTALILIAEIDGRWHVKPTFWLPEQGLAERARKDRVPYDLWHEQGHLETTPGSAIEYSHVAKLLYALNEQLDIRAIAFDRFNMRHLKPWLIDAGFSDYELERWHDFGQGFVSMSPALRELEAALLNAKIRHAGQPVLTMCAANSVVETDPAGNRKLSKKRSRGRIDGMVALAMALSIATTSDPSAGRPFVSIFDDADLFPELHKAPS